MKKLLLLVYLVSNLLANNYEVKLFEKIIPMIFETTDVVVYTDKYNQKLFYNSNFFRVTSNCKEADIIIGKRFKKLDAVCQDKPFFAMSYRAYRKHSNSIGVFYWRKGRPQLKLDLNTIERLNLFLPDTLVRYTK